MGGQREVCTVLEADPDLQDFVVTEDDFVRRRRLLSPDIITQVLIYPIWKIRSEYEDSIIPIQNNLHRVVALQMDFGFGTLSLRKSNYTNSVFQSLLVESAACSRLYSRYVMKLQSLLARTLNLFHVLFERKSAMIEDYRLLFEHLGIWEREEACSVYAQKIYYVLEMCLLLREAMMDSIATGRSVFECSTLNLLETTRFYYIMNLPLPTDPQVRNLMKDLWDQIERENNDPNNN